MDWEDLTKGAMAVVPSIPTSLSGGMNDTTNRIASSSSEKNEVAICQAAFIQFDSISIAKDNTVAAKLEGGVITGNTKNCVS